MTLKKVNYIGQDLISDLYNNISKNVDKYSVGGDDFFEYSSSGNWDIPLSVDYNPELLQELNSDNSEIENSKLVWLALKNLTPSLACEERIWVRFTHGECLHFSRERWDISKQDNDGVEKFIRTHFFASSMTNRRDDNAISRLWWNGWIASQYSQDDFEDALNIILRTADIRSNLIERPWMFRRKELSRGIITFMKDHFLIGEKMLEAKFRAFAITLNVIGSGVVFEGMDDKKIQDFLLNCYCISQSDFES